MMDSIRGWAVHVSSLVGAALLVLLAVAAAFYAVVGWLVAILLFSSDLPWHWGAASLATWALCVAALFPPPK